MGRALLTAALAGAVACGGGGGGGGGADGGGTGGDAGPTTVTLTSYSGLDPAPASLVAFQDGDGPWQAVAGSGGVYTFAVASGRYTVAWVCDPGGGFARVATLRATTGEVTAIRRECDRRAHAAGYSGAVTGLSTGEVAEVWVDDQVGVANSSTAAYAMTGAAGTYDMVVQHQMGATLLDLLIQRGLDVHDGAVFDLDLASAFEAESHAVTVQGIPDGEGAPTGEVRFATASGTASQWLATPPDWPAVPAAELADGDLQMPTLLSSDSTRHGVAFTHAARDVTITVAGPQADPTVASAGSSPYLRMSTTPPAIDGLGLYRVVYSGSATYYPEWTEGATAGWLAGAASATIDTPDLSAVAGWDASWGRSADMIDFIAAGYVSSRTVSEMLDAIDAWEERGMAPASGLDGVDLGWAEAHGQFTP